MEIALDGRLNDDVSVGRRHRRIAVHCGVALCRDGAVIATAQRVVEPGRDYRPRRHVRQTDREI